MRRTEAVTPEVSGSANPARSEGRTRREWSVPVVAVLPPLSELTLQSPIPGDGVIGDGDGSTVF